MKFLYLLLATATADRTPPRIAVDLSLPPQNRWDAVFTTERNASLWEALGLIDSISPLFKTLLGIAAKIPIHDLHGWMPADQADELKAMVRLTKAPIGQLVALNAIYDLTASATTHSHACTSIVVESEDGHISHGRNLDYSLGKAMRKITYIMDFKEKKNKTSFTAVGYLGMTGFNTVVKPGGWALTHDERDQGFIGEDWLNVLLKRRILTFALIRSLAQTAATFDDAVEALSSTPLDAPSYFVVSGIKAGEGALITRSRDPASNNASTPVVYRLDASKGRWYLLETNYDHDGPVDPHDDRRDVGQRSMARLGRAKAASIDGLLTVLGDNGHCNSTRGERPVLNSHTVYTAAFAASDEGERAMRVILREPAVVDGCVP